MKDNKDPTLPQLVCTAGVSHWMGGDESGAREAWVEYILMRFLSSDWGDCDEHDTEVNNYAKRNGGRILGVYETPARLEGRKMYIILEADRSAITVLFTDEY